MGVSATRVRADRDVSRRTSDASRAEAQERRQAQQQQSWEAQQAPLREFRREAKRQKVKLIWATYRIDGNVKGKATQFNSELRRAQKKDDSLLLFDWNRLSGKRPSWFSGDKVHLSRGGTVNLARQLGKFLRRSLTTTESTTTPG